MATATAEAFSNIAFIKENQDKTDRMRTKAGYVNDLNESG
jgi:hypothetical protein